jgi:TRAP-type mannitol/chloroaromatic compound transport system permease large subunit
MSVELVTILFFGGLLVLLSLGIPVVFALGGITVVLTFVLEGYTGLYTVATTYREITDPTLITIPLFWGGSWQAGFWARLYRPASS